MASWDATNIEVGPSAAPIIPIDAASFKSNPNIKATIIVKNIPSWADAPKNIVNGFWSSGSKSIIEPIPINIKSGNSSVAIPCENSKSNIPTTLLSPNNWVIAPDNGKLAIITPNPIGSNRVGSNFLYIAK